MRIMALRYNHTISIQRTKAHPNHTNKEYYYTNLPNRCLTKPWQPQFLIPSALRGSPASADPRSD